MRFRAERWLALGSTLALGACAGGVHRFVPDVPVKLGRPYTVAGRTYVPTDDPDYDATGLASWYGNAEQGRHTASGEIFYRQRVSAANKTLPLPSYVMVTRLDTGRTILVRVNDRGPFVSGRILDLSEEAARELGIVRAGTVLVRVRRVTPTRHQRERLQRGYPVLLADQPATATPPRVGRTAPAYAAPARAYAAPPARAYAPAPSYAPPPASPPAAVAPSPAEVTPPPESALSPAPAYFPPPSPEPAGPHILVASPADPDTADAVASALAAEGAHVVAAGGGYRVVTGPYPDEQARAAALARLRALGYQGAAPLDTSSTRDPNGSSSR